MGNSRAQTEQVQVGTSKIQSLHDENRLTLSAPNQTDHADSDSVRALAKNREEESHSTSTCRHSKVTTRPQNISHATARDPRPQDEKVRTLLYCFKPPRHRRRLRRRLYRRSGPVGPSGKRRRLDVQRAPTPEANTGPREEMLIQAGRSATGQFHCCVPGGATTQPSRVRSAGLRPPLMTAAHRLEARSPLVKFLCR
jgi:hypothetical protein